MRQKIQKYVRRRVTSNVLQAAEQWLDKQAWKILLADMWTGLDIPFYTVYVPCFVCPVTKRGKGYWNSCSEFSLILSILVKPPVQDLHAFVRQTRTVRDWLAATILFSIECKSEFRGRTTEGVATFLPQRKHHHCPNTLQSYAKPIVTADINMQSANCL